MTPGTHNEAVGPVHGKLVQACHIGVLNLTDTAQAALAGLPADVGFAGRLDDLATVAALLTPDATPETPAVAMISGLAGVGKTALAVHAARRAVTAGWFPGGVLFIDLLGYDTAGGVRANAALAELLTGLGVASEHIPATQGQRETRYRSELAVLAGRGDRVLIVVDNASDVADVQALRPGDPAHRMLVTSRDSLPLPAARRVELDVLPDADAVAVLAQALRAGTPDDPRINDEARAARHLARQCGGLPLALRVAAAVLVDRPYQPISGLVRTIAAARDPLAELSFEGVVAVRAAFDASCHRLPAEQVRLFRLLAVHPGSFVGLGALAALADLPEDVAFRLAESLRRAHLIQPAVVPGGYRFHDLVRLYARQKIDTDEVPAAIERLVDYYRGLTVAAKTHLDPKTPIMMRSLRFRGRSSAVAWLESERPNLIPVIDLAARHGHDNHVRDMALAANRFFDLRGHVDEWITVAKYGLASARRLEDNDGVARCLTSLGRGYQDLRWLGEAADHYQQALAVYRRTGDRLGQSRAVLNIGCVSYLDGRPEEAITGWREALRLARDVGDPYQESLALNNIGFVSAELRRYGEAEHHLRQALASAREVPDRQAEGGVLTNLGTVCQQTGRLADAIECHRQALAALAESGDRLREGRALHNMALVYQDTRQWTQALECHQRALAIRREVGDRHGEGLTLTNVGIVRRHQGRSAEAVCHQRQALAAFVQTGADGDAETVRRLIAELL